MKVVASNCISQREALLWFKVEIPIIGLDIIDIPPIAYGNSTLIYFSIGQYCVWMVGLSSLQIFDNFMLLLNCGLFSFNYMH